MAPASWEWFLFISGFGFLQAATLSLEAASVIQHATRWL
jgi:hypothetical protein